MFQRAGNSPADWLFWAYRLRKAAARLDWLDERNIPASEDARPEASESNLRALPSWRHNPDLLHEIPVYCLLMGLSFENLFKAILIAQGMPATESGTLRRAFHTHDLPRLADAIKDPALAISSSERKLLTELGRFVDWQGRYPIPTKELGYSGIFVVNRPEEHKIEQNLWNRLRDHLATIGWHEDVDGNRYKLKLEGARVSIGERA
jgi:hypothetical protein